MSNVSKSFQHNVWQLIFLPAFVLTILISSALVSLYIYELGQFVDLRGNALTRKTAQLIYTPLIQQNRELVQALIDGSLEDPYIRAIHVHVDAQNESLHSGPEFFPAIDQGIIPNSFEPTRRATHRSILFSAPLMSKNGIGSIGWIEMEMMSSPYIVVRYQTILISILLTFAALLGAAFLAARLIKNITAPINHIKETIHLLALGKLTTRIEPQKSLEFVDLADAINEMAESLELEKRDLQNHIEQYTQDLRETLETIEIKNIELDIARKEAIEASRIKSEFLANTSHEIRTPLNGILGFVELVLKTNIDQRQSEYLHTIRDSAQNLLTVINGILDFSKIEAGKLTLEYAPLPIRQTLDETLQILAPQAHEKNQQLISFVDSKIPSHLLGDSLRFKQVIVNLVNNAIKFSTQGNILVRIELLMQQETHVMLKVCITDQGKGLTLDQQNDLFKPFLQTDASNSRSQGGTGLGLAICKGLVERMHGEIGVESQPDKGSTFWFTARLGIDNKLSAATRLPVLNAHRVLLYSTNTDSHEQIKQLFQLWQANVDTIDEIHDIFPTIRKAQTQHPFELFIVDIAPYEKRVPSALLNNISQQLFTEFHCKVIVCCTPAHQKLFREQAPHEHTLFIDKPVAYNALLNTACEQLNENSAPAQAHQNNSMDSRPAPLVLLVDDNPANLQLASEFLRGLNTQVVQASNGLQAVDACKQQVFDVIFMDIQMPGMDGFEATRRIRANEAAGKRTPIIALTAHSLTEQKSELLIAGMDDCISKPVSESQLAHIINRWASLTGKKEVLIAEPFNDKQSAASTAEQPTPEPAQSTSDIVDIQLCLKLANRIPSLARDMLNMMLANLPTEKAEIIEAVDSDNIPQLGELIHRLYGSCCYCGVPQLKHVSGALDKLLQEGHVDDTKEAMPKLYTAIDEVIAWGDGRDINALFGLTH